MTRSIHFLSLLFRAAVLVALVGCEVETESPSGILPVSGTVKLDGVPVKKATISFTPIHDEGMAASGEIIDGAIRNLTTRKQGDGHKLGRYHVAIAGIGAKTQAFMDDPNTRSSQGPDLVKLTALWKDYENPVPPHYANSRTSGLTVEVVPQGSNDFRFDLKGNEPPKETASATSPTSTPSKTP